MSLDFNSIIGGLTGSLGIPGLGGETASACPVGDTACREAENAAAAQAALAAKAAEEAKFREEIENIPVSSTGLACSMDGFADMAIKLVENLLLIVSLLKETLAYAFPPELAESLELLWKGLVGSSSWMGFLAYSLYGVGLDYGFAMDVCEAFGYGYYVIDGMNYIVAFAAPSEDGSIDIMGAATDALNAAGLGDVAGALTDAVDAIPGASDLIDQASGAITDAVSGGDAAAEGDAAAAEGDAAAAEGDAAAAEGSG